MSHSQHPVLTPYSLKSLTLANRAVVAPMTRNSATQEGVPTQRMVDYYRSFITGGFGAIISEGTYTDTAFSQGYVLQPGLVNQAQIDGWRAVTDAVHAAGGVIFVQLMHAGALSFYLPQTIAPSVFSPAGERRKGYGDGGPYPTPIAMGEEHIAEAILGFVDSAQAAVEAGFDGVEIHGANGYLIDQFLTDYSNTRTDHYGGDIAKRARFGVEVAAAVRSKVSDSIPVGVRLSQGKINNALYEWPNGPEDATVLFSEYGASGADFLHVANEGQSWRDTSRYDGDRSLSQVAREASGLPVIANGNLEEPELAAHVVRENHGDLISLGRAALANRDWPQRVADGRKIDEFDPAMVRPWSSLEFEDEWWRNRQQ